MLFSAKHDVIHQPRLYTICACCELNFLEISVLINHRDHIHDDDDIEKIKLRIA